VATGIGVGVARGAAAGATGAGVACGVASFATVTFVVVQLAAARSTMMAAPEAEPALFLMPRSAYTAVCRR
jgi:hypothetical protein